MCYALSVLSFGLQSLNGRLAPVNSARVLTIPTPHHGDEVAGVTKESRLRSQPVRGKFRWKITVKWVNFFLGSRLREGPGAMNSLD